MQGRNRWDRKGGIFDAEPLLKARAVSSVIKGPDLSEEACVTCAAVGGSYCRVLHSSLTCPGQSRLCSLRTKHTHTHTFWFEQRLLQPEALERGLSSGIFGIELREFQSIQYIYVTTHHFHLYGRVSLGNLKQWEPNGKEYIKMLFRSHLTVTAANI